MIYLLFDLLRLVRFIVSGQYFWRRKLLSNVSFIGLPNKAILEYVEDNIPESKKYNIVSFPFAMSSEDFPQKENNKSRLTFTIPGSLSDDVRDYISVLNVIKSISVILKNPIKVVLLGRPRDNFGINTLALFTELELPLIEIKTFSEYISQDSFDKHLRDSDFLILPLKEYTQFGVFREITCKSKLSGSINDVIKSGIPTIASHYCTVDKEVDKNFIYYRSQEEMEMEILKINQNWNDNMPETSTMKRFTNFTKEKLLQDFNDIISSL